MDRTDEEKMHQFINKLVKKNQQKDETDEFKQPLERTEEPIVLAMKLKPKKVVPLANSIDKKVSSPNRVEIKKEVVSDDENFEKSKTTTKRKEIQNEQPECSSKKLKSHEKYSTKGWLRKGLFVKIITKSLGDKYYKAKIERYKLYREL